MGGVGAAGRTWCSPNPSPNKHDTPNGLSLGPSTIALALYFALALGLGLLKLELLEL